MAHRLLDRTVIGNDDVVGCHPATDLFLIVGKDQVDIILRFLIHARDQGFFFLWI